MYAEFSSAHSTMKADECRAWTIAHSGVTLPTPGTQNHEEGTSEKEINSATQGGSPHAVLKGSPRCDIICMWKNPSFRIYQTRHSERTSI